MLDRYAKEPAVGVVVVTHETYGEAFLAAARSIVGDLPAVAAVSVSQHMPLSDVVAEVSAAFERVDEGAGALMLVDLHGSTPFQACMAMLDGSRPAEVLCGVNLPMLMKLATVNRRELRPTELAEALREVGRRSIRLGSELTGKVMVGEPR